MYGSVGAHEAEGVEWGGSKTGVLVADLHPRLRAPNPALVTLMLAIIFAAVCVMLAFCAGHFIPWLLAMVFVLSTLWPLELRARGYPSASWMMGMCVAAAGFGALAGIVTFHKFGAAYLAGVLGRPYTNVTAEASALAHADGGTIRFMQDVVLDPKFGVGSQLSGRRVCAAPIVHEAANADLEDATVQFWAVGINCCPSRGRFECGDANDPSTHGGLVLHDDEDMPFSSFLPVRNHHDDFMAVVQASAELHQLQLPSAPVLISWAHDPDAVLLRLLIKSLCACGICILAFCCIAYGLWHEIHTHHDVKIRRAVAAVKRFGHGNSSRLGGDTYVPALSSAQSLAATYTAAKSDKSLDGAAAARKPGVPLWGAGAKGFGSGGPAPEAARAALAHPAHEPAASGQKVKAQDPFLVSF